MRTGTPDEKHPFCADASHTIAGVGFGNTVWRSRAGDRCGDQATRVGSTTTSAPAFGRFHAHGVATHRINKALAQAKHAIDAATQVCGVWGVDGTAFYFVQCCPRCLCGRQGNRGLWLCFAVRFQPLVSAALLATVPGLIWGQQVHSAATTTTPDGCQKP